MTTPFFPASQAPEAIPTASPSLVAPMYFIFFELITPLITEVKYEHGTPEKKLKPCFVN